MTALWMTSLRPVGKSADNDKIQEVFINSVQNIKYPIKFSLTQFDDENVEELVSKKNLNAFFINVEKNKLPSGKKYSNKIMLDNALDQFISGEFEYLIYSTADLLIPNNVFDIANKLKNQNNEFCALVFPNILQKNGSIKSVSEPHYGIDLFIFKINKNSAEKLKNAISSWEQYDWGINDNFYVSVCDLLNLPIYNIYKSLSVIKFENDFKTINENRDWQIQSWKQNQNYFLNFLKENKLSKLYAIGSYHYLLLKIFRLKDMSAKLLFTYFKFYLRAPLLLVKKILKKFFR
tara:strand:+ start:190 stop:1062 length:873 start_codon:yes stop_codon:yes gene_type:complete